MKEIGIEELKSLQVEMVRKIDAFCRENDIRYSLAYGTLIGAIRHKGYIPWDDDIDLMMARPDYNKFLQLFNGKVENLIVMAPEINPHYYASYANVFDNRTLLIEKDVSHMGVDVGVKIDIFPIDGVPDDEFEYRALMRRILRYKKILSIKRIKISSIHKIIPLLRMVLGRFRYLFYSYGRIQKEIISLCNRQCCNNTDYIDHLSFPVYPYKRFERKDFSSFVSIEFEGQLFMCLKEFDDYLSVIYGDYMQLPPEEKRIPHHNFTAYWKD